MPTPESIIAAYDTDAASLFEPYEDIDSTVLYSLVHDLFPSPPARVADIGAGKQVTSRGRRRRPKRTPPSHDTAPQTPENISGW